LPDFDEHSPNPQTGSEPTLFTEYGQYMKNHPFRAVFVRMWYLQHFVRFVFKILTKKIRTLLLCEGPATHNEARGVFI
jgi:hypothetical protein